MNNSDRKSDVRKLHGDEIQNHKLIRDVKRIIIRFRQSTMESSGELLKTYKTVQKTVDEHYRQTVRPKVTTWRR
jgi:hypothetical protein